MTSLDSASRTSEPEATNTQGDPDPADGLRMTDASPRIAALRRDLQSGAPDSLERFWARAEREGAPLVERVADGPHHVLVTFLWRDRDGDTESVIVTDGPAGAYWDRSDGMRRLLETDVWYATFRVRADLRGRYRLLVNTPTSNRGPVALEDYIERWRAGRVDPLSRAQWFWPANETDPESHDERFSLLELPDAPPQPWLAPRPGVPQGTVDEYSVTSEHLGNTRRVWLYTPPPASTADDDPPGVAVLLDGCMWALVDPIAPTLDNLIAERRIPPLVVVMPDYVDGDTRWRELSCNETFLTFLTDELLPWVRERCAVTKDPRRTIIAGQSLGGLASAYAGYTLPQVFGNVLAQSGCFWWKDRAFWEDRISNEEGEPDPEGDLLIRWFAETPPLPLRFYLDVGMLESRKLLMSNRRLRDVLQRKGYDISYQEFHSGHEYVAWRGTLADGLIALIGADGNGR